MSNRSKELRAVAENYIKIHDEWRNPNNNREDPDDEYWDGFESLIEAYEAGEIPADCRRLATAVFKLQELVEDWERIRDTLENRNHPTNSVWFGVDLVRKALKAQGTAELPPLEPIPVLEKQKVDHKQIARMYGLFDERGEPQGYLIQQELDKPGSVITKDWVDPRLKDIEQREKAANRHATRIADRNPNPPSPPCPETPRELFDQKVEPEQAAKMLRRPLEEVKAMFAEFAGKSEKKDKPKKQVA